MQYEVWRSRLCFADGAKMSVGVGTKFHNTPLLPYCRVEAICVLNQKKVFEDKSYARVCGCGGGVLMAL